MGFRIEGPGVPELVLDAFETAIWRVRDLLAAGATEVRLWLGTRLLREWIQYRLS